jgi:acyl carrier protein phosphodiesterase
VNFLAHLHLSEGTPASMLGGVLADFVKPAQVAALPDDVRAGIELHRRIDGFTDRHPIVQQSIGRISRAAGWFAGIVIDVYYDHLLARDWPRYSDEPLRDFADRAYAALGRIPPRMEGEAPEFVRRFIADDRLARYATREGIAETLGRLSDRIALRIPRRPVRLETAMPELDAADANLAADFHAFYPELRLFADQCKAGRTSR